MSTQNNNFTVENLVAKYRDYVDEHCPKAYDVSEWVDKEGKAHFEEFHTPCSPEANAGEQLLTVIYKTISGDNAQKDIVDALSQFSNAYYPNVLSEDEIAFLCKNYKETVEYLFAHRDEWTAGIKYHLNKISEERKRLVKENAKPAAGSIVFVADAEYCDLAVQFPNCTIKGFTGLGNNETKTAWALGQIRMWALGIKSEIVSGEGEFEDYSYELPERGSVDLVILRANGHGYLAQNIFGTECNDINALYDLLKPNGRMIFFSEFLDEMTDSMRPNKEIVPDIFEMAAKKKKKKRQLSKDLVSAFRFRVVKEHTIETIVSFEEEGILGNGTLRKSIMLVLKKADLKSVCVKSESMGISRDVEIEGIDGDILWPGYYLANKPKNGIPLSELVEYHNLEKIFVDLMEAGEVGLGDRDSVMLSNKIKSLLVVAPIDMSSDYKEANLRLANLKTAGEAFFEGWRGWIRPIDRPCVLLYGREGRLVTGYINKLAIGEMATLSSIVCLTPKDGIDVRYVAALLLSPEVKEQIITICSGDVDDYTLPLVMNKIIVPNHTDKERLAFLADASDNAIKSLKQEMADSIETKISVLKADYINEVRMRKHDTSPHLLQIKSAERLMRHYIETTTDIEELKKHLLAQVDYVDNALTVISEIVEHLSEEEKFGVAEIINIDKFLEDVELNHNDREGFTIEYDCDRESFRKIGLAIPNMIEEWEKSKKQGESPKDFIRKGYLGPAIPNMIEEWEKAEKQGVNFVDFVRKQTKENLPLYAEIAPIDFQRMVTNIIENARRHAFIDPSRDDYYIGIDLSLDNKTGMYQIDFSNNGNPLPEGMTKERYGIRGEKVGATAGTGSGGYIIKSIVNHYGGDYDVFTKDGITTIRIYLPIASKV